MGQIHRFLGLDRRAGSSPDIDDCDDKRDAYACDVTYGTNTEFGFDYLRDNMARSADAMVQRGHPFAIVDEVDSILIDEARTPLIISGPAAESAKLYYQFAGIVRTLARRGATTRSTRRSASSSPPRRASRRSSASSASTTCTTRCRSTTCTT